MHDPITVHIQRAGDQALVELAGELDMAATPAVLDAVDRTLQDDARRLIIDLGGVTLCDSVGLATLVRARRRALAAGRDLIVIGLRAQARQLLNLTGLISYLTGEPRDPKGQIMRS
jgi:anti-anti-sigma factor